MHARRLVIVVVAFATVAAMLGGGAAASTSHLLALYTFNGTLADASGHNRTAHDTGTPVYASGAPFGGKAIVFSPAGNAIVLAPLNISPAARPQLTMGAWVKAASVATPQYGIISNDDGNYDRTLGIDSRPASSGVVWSAFIGGNVVGSVPVVTKKWYFIAISYDQSTQPGKYAFYVNDGSKTTTLAGVDSFDTDSHTDAVDIGRNPSFDSSFSGEAANAFFYAGVLTKSQIASIVARGPSAIPR
jgi:concanavalin A-like lectin/glucanase superfamily protein